MFFYGNFYLLMVWESLASQFVLDLLSCTLEWVMANNRSSAGTVACLGTKGLASGVTVSQLYWKGPLEAASQPCTALLCQSISRCRKESFPRPAALTMRRCKTKSDAKQVRVLFKLCQKVPALFWPKTWPSEPYHKQDSLPPTMVSVLFKSSCRLV